MARRVYHIKNPNYNGDNSYGKTLCNREATHRYRFVTTTTINSGAIPGFMRICPRCRQRAERMGLIRPAGIAPDGTVDGNEVSSDDTHHDEWLSRLGIC